jgi:hypothetical protein
MAWKWICISLKSWMVSWYKNNIIQASVSNCMRQCFNFLVLNIHIPTYLGSRGKPFFETSKFFWCLPIVDKYEFVYTNLNYLFKGTCNFHYCETYEPQKTVFFIICTESICKYVCRVYHQLLQYIAKLRQITIDLCKSRLVTIETPRNHSLSQH